MVHTAAAPEAARQGWLAAGAELLEVAANEAGQIDPRAAMQALAAKGLTRILSEGGGQLAASLIAAGLVDDLASYHAGALIGGDGRAGMAALGLSTLADAPRFALIETCQLGGDQFSLWSRKT